MQTNRIGFEPADARVAAAISWIHQDLSRDITIKDAAAHVHMTSVHLGNIFKADVGMTWRDYVVRVRMEHAKKLLHDFSLTLDDVARCCGYRNSAAFGVSFKRCVGMNPSVYRRKAVR